MEQGTCINEGTNLKRREYTFPDGQADMNWHLSRWFVSASSLSRTSRHKLQPLLENSAAHSFLAKRPALIFQYSNTFSSIFSLLADLTSHVFIFKEFKLNQSSDSLSKFQLRKFRWKMYQEDVHEELQSRSSVCDTHHTEAHALYGKLSPNDALNFHQLKTA